MLCDYPVSSNEDRLVFLQLFSFKKTDKNRNQCYISFKSAVAARGYYTSIQIQYVETHHCVKLQVFTEVLVQLTISAAIIELAYSMERNKSNDKAPSSI